MSQASQGDLFGGGSPAPPAAATARVVRESVQPAAPEAESVALAARLPRTLHLGTSSWSTPGWQGRVYADRHDASILARAGLPAYARHPLLRGVGLDSTFYAPAQESRLARWAAQVPEDFRFVVKAWSALTTSPLAPRPAQLVRVPDHFLDAALAADATVEPAVRGLGTKLGVLVFQFPPLGRGLTRDPARFIARLGRFLERLPRGPRYAVELRDPEFLGREYEAALAAAGVVHCANVHPRMPPVDAQPSGALPGQDDRAPLVVRWMLHPGHSYESAGRCYAPYDRLVEPDEANRERVAALSVTAIAAGRTVHVVANNKAEGSAPLTLESLARSIDRRRPQAW